MESINNLFSTLLKSYDNKIKKTFEKRPDVVINYISDLTDWIDKSDKSSVEKLYTK